MLSSDTDKSLPDPSGTSLEGKSCSRGKADYSRGKLDYKNDATVGSSSVAGDGTMQLPPGFFHLK